MTVSTEFHNWSDNPHQGAKSAGRGSPALMHVRDYHLRRWGGMSLSSPSLYQFRLLKSGRTSSHAGSAVDLRWMNPGPGRDVVLREILPFYIDNSLELHIQAIHDYVGCRVWRAHRSGDANHGWKTQPVGSHDGKMGDPSSQWLHLEVNHSGWDDDRPVEEMLAGVAELGVPSTVFDGNFGLFPLNPNKPITSPGDEGEYVLYPQCVIFFKAGGAIDRDGRFGTQTKTRVNDMQRLFELPPTGVIDEPTWRVVDLLAGT